MTKQRKAVAAVLCNTVRVKWFCDSLMTAFAKKGFAISMAGAILDLMAGEIDEAKAAIKETEAIK